uniref:Uncharacterized protein n=1 Tax=Arundo donax TaxID=35708 RepID=A0A0A8Z8W8_ARUDO
MYQTFKLVLLIHLWHHSWVLQSLFHT